MATHPPVSGIPAEVTGVRVAEAAPGAVLAGERGQLPADREEAGSGTTSEGAITGCPVARVLLVRRAMAAAATMKMLPARSPRWYPAVSASGRAAFAASRLSVRLMAIAESMARPSALPSCWEAFSRPAARPAWLGGTPA